MNEARRRAWEALELGPLWVRRARTEPADEAPHPVPEVAEVVEVAAAEAPGPEASAPDLDSLDAQVSNCRRCGLCESRSNTVFGVGDRQAHWMVIGEAPGADEDRLGEPFVGRAGQLLDAMLFAVGRSRRQGVYIANVLKCRPPGNRDPLPEEAAHCLPYLRRQIQLIRPRLILVVGKVAAQALLDTDASLASLRGRVHRLELDAESIPVVVSYHPAYLLRTPLDKAKAWEDLRKAVALSSAEPPGQ